MNELRWRNSNLHHNHIPFHEVHLWLASLDEIVIESGPMTSLLSADEIDRAKRFTLTKETERFKTGRAVLRIILSRCLGLNPSELSFTCNPYGKPALDSGDLFFNMSRSGGYAIYAVSRNQRIGVDIETIRNIADIDDIAGNHFSESERAYLNRSGGRAKTRSFFKIWTRKEALVKAVGKGLSIPLQTFDVIDEPGRPIHWIRFQDQQEGEIQWVLHDLEPYHGCLTAVAVESSRDHPPNRYVSEFLSTDAGTWLEGGL